MKINNQNISAHLMDTFLFSGIENEVADALIKHEGITVEEFDTSCVVSSPIGYKKRIGFVISGECTVERRSECGSVPLNVLRQGDCFGILNIFSNEDQLPTYVTATKKSKILFIGRDILIEWIRGNSKIAMNIIEFMSNRISFLNKKISTFSQNNVKQKVANHILILSNELGDEFKLNCQKTSKSLNVGRASLYRSIDALVTDGVIIYSDKIIKIVNKEKLERISK